MHANVEAVVGAGAQLGVIVEPHSFPDGTRTAEDAARAIGVEVGQIVKSLVFDVVTDEGPQPVIALVSGSNRLDEAKLAAAADARQARRVDADRVREVTGYPIGGVPPFGHAAPITTFVDPDLLGYDEVWAAAGTPRDVFPIAPEALVAATRAVTADLAQSRET
jgi:prolyl-tRNA editing enzyme YbaK/EbsC (Cys-tRNA(Pro) deacylase)